MLKCIALRKNFITLQFFKDDEVTVYLANNDTWKQYMIDFKKNYTEAEESMR